MLRVWNVCVILLNIYLTQCSRILGFFPTPSISHQVVFRPLMHELARLGHEVIVVTTDPAFSVGKTPANLTEIDVHDISYDNWKELLDGHDGKTASMKQTLIKLIAKFTTTFEKQLETPQVKHMLEKERNNFDLVIIEQCIRPALGLGHLLKAPIIQFSSCGILPSHYGKFGAPSHPILYPTPVNDRIYNLSILEKSWAVVKTIAIEYLQYYMLDFDYAMAKRNFGEDLPTFDELLDKYVQMVFVNEHPIWAHNHPVPSNVVLLGGIHQAQNVTLPEELKTFLDSSKHGVIYISFGTNVKPSNFPQEKIEVMINVCSKLPYDVLWKWDGELPRQPKKIKVSKWFPQAELLKHPKIKLFITQGGLQSTDETITAAVPVIGIPMLGDQWYNTEKYVHHQIGMQLDLHSLTEAQFSKAVTTVIEDKSYKSNILKLRSQMQDFPVKPLDLAVRWTEHVLKHGGLHLRSPAFIASTWDYYEIPLVLIALFSLVSVLVTMLYVLKFIFRRILRAFSTRVKPKKA